jgi:hypothetical protein
MKLSSRNTRIGYAIKLLCLVMILSISCSMKAQSFYGSIVGIVTDATGAVVPGAKVTAVNIGTNEASTTNSDSAGKFDIVNLVPATYSVEVTRAGFKRFLRESLTVEVGSVVRVEAGLQVGGVNETVEVQTLAPLMQSDTSTMSTEISGAEVQQIPLNGRNVMNLIALAPGVIPNGGALGGTGLNQGTRTAGGAGWGNYQIGGAIQGQSAQYIDGVANNVLGGNTVALVPTQDAVQEFSVATSNAGADFGRFAGGVVNMTTRSGANAFHGSAWEYFRNADLNANDFFGNRVGSQRPQWNQNQYGAMATGPIKRDKAFFMFAWEGFAALTGLSSSTSVPTTGMQNGIIPEVYDVKGNLLNTSIADPLGNCNITHQPGTAASPGTWTITNLYSGSCGDPLNKIIKSYYPAPNVSGSSFNWFINTPLTNHQNQYNGRVDYVLSSKQRLFGRYTYWTLHDTGHSEFNRANGWPTNDGHVINDTHQAVLGDTYTFNSSIVLDVRVNYVREYSPNFPDSNSVDQKQFGATYASLAPQMSLHVLPAYNASGGFHSLYNFGNFTGDSVNWWNTYGINANLIKIVGAHTLKFGTELRLMDGSGTGFDNQGSGQYSYGPTYSGDEWASFLMGYPTQIQFKTINSTAAYSYYKAFYVTDTWQATRNLTMTLGLRYELPGAVAERKDRATVLLPSAVDPNTGVTGTLALVKSSLYGGRSTVQPRNNLFAPRVGLAYRLNNSTSIRGGYGISYLPNDLTGGVMPYNSQINGAATQVNITGALPTPLQTALQGILASGINQPIGRSNPAFMTNLVSKTNYLGQSISGPVPFQPYPWVQQWNLALGHEFKGDMMAEIAYSGLKGLNIPGAGNKNLNELQSQFYGQGSALLVKQACATANNEVMAVGQCDRTFPYYNNVQDTAEFYARNNFKSVQARFAKRFRTGMLMANYTWSKNMGNTDTQNGYLESKPSAQTASSGAGQIQDWNNLAGEYSLLSYNVTNRAVISYVLNLPFGKGQKFANFDGPVSTLVSGWAINGVTSFQSGFPLFFNTASQSKLQQSFGGGTTRPNVVAGCAKGLGTSSLSRVNAGAWFNTSCFAYAGDYAFGNEPRVDPDLRADAVKNFDFSFQKSTPFYERANLEFRTEFFNVFNRVQFAPPVATQGAGNFGAVLSQVNKPRQIQLSLRVNF